MSPKGKKTLKVIVAVETATVVVALLVWAMLARSRNVPAREADANRQPAQQVAVSEPNLPRIPLPPAPQSRGAESTPASAAATSVPSVTRPAESAAEARRALAQGRSLLAEGKLLDARSAISKAFFSDLLTAEEEAQAAQVAAELADKTVFSREIIDGDPYNIPYTVQANDKLAGAKGVEMTLRLHVPERLLLKINGLARGEDLRPGRTIKLLRGPFHATVYKSRFLMDIYLQRDDLEKILVRRIQVGLGRNGSTPLGAWRVQQGQKMICPPYNATEGSGLPVGTRVLHGQPGYPFGIKGLWIGLEGTEARTAGVTDFGIHSTNDPASIGKANSLGCVRMADADIDLVFSLLYDVHSRVEVMP
jgi:hypothetical protein